MLSERDVDYLREILRQIDLADKFLGTMTLQEFEADELRLYAVVDASKSSRRRRDVCIAKRKKGTRIFSGVPWPVPEISTATAMKMCSP